MCDKIYERPLFFFISFQYVTEKKIERKKIEKRKWKKEDECKFFSLVLEDPLFYFVILCVTAMTRSKSQFQFNLLYFSCQTENRQNENESLFICVFDVTALYSNEMKFMLNHLGVPHFLWHLRWSGWHFCGF